MDAQKEQKCVILAVDDDDDVRELLRESLVLMGHEVHLARDGVEALETLAKVPVDLVITDMSMPRLGGLELIAAIVEDHEDVDIIAVTGYEEKYRYTDVIAAGAADFIGKPFNIDELEAKINRILRERALRQQLKKLSIRDGLTGLYNRRHFDDTLKKEVSRALRQHYNIYLFLIDIDNFKEYNDRYGHQQGDAVLKEIAKIMELYVRKNVDSCFRYGGDEFAVIVPHANRRQALMVAERLRRKYEEAGHAPTSVSIGMAKLGGHQDNAEQSATDLLRRADKALYLAKQAGGNQVCAEEGNCDRDQMALALEISTH